MDHPHAIGIEAPVPTRDRALSRRFYADIGFEERSETGGVAYFALGDRSFLPQDFYRPEHAGNFVMHLPVDDARTGTAACTRQASRENTRRGRTSRPTAHGACGDFCLGDPPGVPWRIAQNLGGRPIADG